MVNNENNNRERRLDGKQETNELNDDNEGGNGVHRRSFLKAAGAGAGGLALTGCLGNIGGGGGGVPDTISIGVMGPAEAPFGASILNSAKLAADEMNQNNGIAGADVEVITKDTQDDPGVARSVYQELTTGENVDFTVGVFGSEQLLAILPNIAQQGKLHLSTGAATPEATRKVSQDYEKFKYYFRVGPVNSHFLGQSLIEFAKDEFESMGWNRIAMIIEDFKWTEPIRNVINQRLSEVGVEVPVEKVVPEGTKDFTPIYDEMTNANVDGAYTVLAHIGSTSLVQWAKQRRQFGYGGIHVPTQLPSYYKATKGAAIATFSQNTATPTSEITSKTVPYADSYRNQFGKYPVYDGYITYDAMYLLKLAVEEEQSVNSDDLVPVLEQVNKSGGTEFTGAAGVTKFFPKDHEFAHDLQYTPMTKGIYFQWQPEGETGAQKVIWSGDKDLNTVDYMSPPWVSGE
ncbi:MAG: ABC transporter substrate-binding protein [Halobacteria archaeon]|nr:ABC transporter substrate-binding protein [Halobacteria archaeon]